LIQANDNSSIVLPSYSENIYNNKSDSDSSDDELEYNTDSDLDSKPQKKDQTNKHTTVEDIAC
jgi:hypothetical protein